MATQLEIELTEALAARVRDLPSGAVDRIGAVDYRPRARRVRRVLAVPALGGAAVAGSVASVVVLSGAQPAFAGWSATPALVDAPGTSAAASCTEHLADLPSPPGFTAPTTWNPVLTDVRGPFTVVVYQSGADDATCFTGPGFTTVHRTMVDGSSVSQSQGVTVAGGSGTPQSGSVETLGGAALAGGPITRLTVSHLDSSAGAYTLVEGQTQSGVSAVTFARDDGSDVQATTGSGWLIAWWPGDQTVTAADVTTPSGTVTQQLQLQPVGPPAPGACSHTGSGTAANGTSCGGGSAG
jgi:hypothetical protein